MPVGAGKYQLGRADPVGPARQQRIQTQVRAVGGIDATPLLEAQIRHGDQVADTRGKDQVQQLSDFVQGGLYGDGEKPGILSVQGDPTSHYVNFQNELNQRIRALQDENKDLPARQKDIINARIKNFQLQSSKLLAVNEHQQYKKYETFVNQREVTKAINDVTFEGALEYADEKGSSRDPASVKFSFEKVDQALNRVYQASLIGGPSMEVSPEGAVGMAVGGLIDNAISTDKFDLARQLLQKYNRHIPKSKKAKLNETLTRRETELKGLQLAREVRHLSPRAAEKKFAKANVRVARAARQQYRTVRNADIKEKGEIAANARTRMLSKIYSGEIKTAAEARLEKDYDFLDAPGIKDVEGQLKERPDTTNPEVEFRLIAAYNRGEHLNLDSEERVQAFATRYGKGMSPTRFTEFLKTLRKTNLETEGKVRTKVRVTTQRVSNGLASLPRDELLGLFRPFERKGVATFIEEQIALREDDIAKSTDGGVAIAKEVINNAKEIAEKLDEFRSGEGYFGFFGIPTLERFREEFERRQRQDAPPPTPPGVTGTQGAPPPGPTGTQGAAPQPQEPVITSTQGANIFAGGRTQNVELTYARVKPEVDNLPPTIRSILQGEDGEKKEISTKDLADQELRNFILKIYMRLPGPKEEKPTDERLKRVWDRI